MADITNVTENLTKLLTNSVNMSSIFYDMFINTTPMDITLKQYDSNDILQTYIIPNRAKDRKTAIEGIIDPEGNVSSEVGIFYTNTTSGSVFFKASGSSVTGWREVFSSSVLLEGQLSTDVTFSENSDSLIPSQKAVKTYVEAQTGLASYVGAVEPSIMSAAQLWLDNSNTAECVLKQRSQDNTSWVEIGRIVGSTFKPSGAFLSTDTTVTTQGNTFNTANKLVQLDESGALPSLDGSKLTGVQIPDTIISLGTFAGGTITLTKDKLHNVIISGATTIALPTGLTSGVHYNCAIIIKLSSVVAVTQPTATWTYNSAPSLNSTSVRYRLIYETIDGGTTWFGYWTQLGA